MDLISMALLRRGRFPAADVEGRLPSTDRYWTISTLNVVHLMEVGSASVNVRVDTKRLDTLIACRPRLHV
jgi:hypothetical protein